MNPAEVNVSETERVNMYIGFNNDEKEKFAGVFTNLLVPQGRGANNYYSM